MVDYSIALKAQNPQIDLVTPFKVASQMRRDNLAEQESSLRQRAAESQLSAREDKQNALRAYNDARRSGDPGAIENLSQHPQLMSQMMQIRSQMDAGKRAKFDQTTMRNARRAQRVMGLEGEEKEQAWQEELAAARDSGDLSPELYERYASSPANNLLLRNLVDQALPLEKAFAKPKTPAAVQTAQYAAGLDPDDPAQKRQLDYLTTPKTQVNLPATEKAYESKRGGTIAEAESKIEDEVDAAYELASTYRQITDHLQAPGVYSGTGGEAVAALKRMGKTVFGLDIDNVADATVARKVGDMAVAQIKKIVDDPKMTDSDRNFYRAIPPNLADDAEGAQMLAEIAQSDAEHKVLLQNKLYDLLGRENVPRAKSFREWRQWKAKQNRWSSDLYKRVKAKAARARQRTPDAGMRKLLDKYGLEQ